MTERIYWTISSYDNVSRQQRPVTLSPVVLRRTDNLEAEVEELRVETPDGEQVLNIVEPWWSWEDRGIKFTGHVPRSGRHKDPEETWFARPLAAPGSDPVSWHVEFVETETNDIIDVIEEATLDEVEVALSAGGALVHTADLSIDEWLALDIDDREFRLLIRGARRGKRWITEYDFHRLLPFEVTLEGQAKHKSEQVDVHVRLTPSGYTEAARALGAPHVGHLGVD